MTNTRARRLFLVSLVALVSAIGVAFADTPAPPRLRERRVAPRVLRSARTAGGVHIFLTLTAPIVRVHLGEAGRLRELTVLDSSNDDQAIYVDTFEEGRIRFPISARREGITIRGDMGFIKDRRTRSFRLPVDPLVEGELVTQLGHVGSSEP
jgi:hypothetical protein